MNSHINSFNIVSEEFFQKLLKTFPNENKFSVYYTNFIAAKTFSNRLPVEYIMNNMKDYGYWILTRDEKFFKSDNIISMAESFSEKSGLVDIWESMDNKIKNNVWEYIQSMYVLGMRSMELDDELNNIIEKIKVKS